MGIRPLCVDAKCQIVYEKVPVLHLLAECVINM